jgi:predicted CXXCH cytochrome family protein
VGVSVCKGCHQKSFDNWQGSHHDLAMQPATNSTVLGDFDNVSFTQYGVTSVFYKQGDRFFVKTEGESGELQEFEIGYAFGFYPLQQYLIDFSAGRKQALSIAWDSRPAEEGGQKWFHLYPDEKISATDVLHWTKPGQNWNTMCAECHSMNLQKNYNVDTATFDTTWTDIDVSCESCHGPGSNHVNWAKRVPGWNSMQESLGFVLHLDERKGVFWQTDPTNGKPVRSELKVTDKEIEMCARCHSRRSPISENYAHGERLMDHYLPRTLDAGLYHDDGQIEDEVYVYGSFRQSKMYQAGVTCSDCHEPHSNELKLPGNTVCLQCHETKTFSQASHHFHDTRGPGAVCADCHMPAKGYMVVDPRHDHSMRVPRPDLSEKFDTPNACTNCHLDKSAGWAADKVRTWYGRDAKGFQGYTAVLSAARAGESSASGQLAELIRDTSSPEIARATGLTELGPALSLQTIDVLPLALSDSDPAVRTAAVSILDRTPYNVRARLAFPMLEDPVRMVRIAAARVLANIPIGDLDPERRALLTRVGNEYIAAQMANAERPEAWANLGNFYAAKRAWRKAIEVYRKAIETDPVFVPSYTNLADLYRVIGDEANAEKVLQEGLVWNKDDATIHHTLGLSLVRQGRIDEALIELEIATGGAINNPRFVYVYAVALNSTGKTMDAISTLTGAHDQFPNDQDILQALISFNRELGNDELVRIYTSKLGVPR